MIKILFFSLLIIFIPYIIVTFFIKEEKDNEITFNYQTNQVVRVYLEQDDAIIKVPLEKYIIGVLSGEVPASFSQEALKAQAVASRSYVLYKMQNNKHENYDVINTQTNQVYLTESQIKDKWQNQYIENINKIKQAVLDTKGQYLMYNNQLVEAMFFSTSNGYTENSEDIFDSQVPYLRSVSSTWDEISPVYTSKTTLSLTEFYEKLNLEYNDNLTIEILEQTTSGRIKKIKINNQEFTGNEVTDILNLRSNCFTITQNNHIITIHNKGYGHGVGMSQYGAQAMANLGYNYEEILKYYYTGVQIKK